MDLRMRRARSLVTAMIGSGVAAMLAGSAAAFAPIAVGEGAFSGSATLIDFNGTAFNQVIDNEYAPLGVTFSGPLYAHIFSGDLGNGFALRRETLERVPYTASSVVEDLEYHLKLIEAGVSVAFADDTAIRGEMPTGEHGANTQRARWEGGRLRMLREPRGYPALCCNVIMPPTHPDAAAGFIIMEQTEYPPMSGTNTICVATALLETGMIPMREPVTEFILEAPAGLVVIRAECRDGKVTQVTFKNVPAFAVHLNVKVEVPTLGTRELAAEVSEAGL